MMNGQDSDYTSMYHYTCEQCELKEASYFCYRCADDDDPFLYCEDCMNVAHRGRKRCYHQEETIVGYDKMIAKVNSTIGIVQSNIEQHDNILQEERASIVASAAEVETSVHCIFVELKSLLDVQEKEVMLRISHIKEKRLSLFGKKETACNDIKNMVEESIQSVNDNAEFILTSTKPHCRDDALEKITKKLEERSSLIDRFFEVSPYPAFTGVLGIVPSITRLKEYIKSYTIPYISEWEEGDLINNCIVYNSKTIIVKSNHFWVGEHMNTERYVTLCHISESLSDLATNSPKLPITDIVPDTLVCAYYERESSWHRGFVEKIIDRRGQKMVSVRFLDYGNSEEICPNLVIKLPPEFAEYPFQCRFCRFSNDNNIAYTDRETKWKLNDYVKGRELTVKIMSRTYSSRSVLPEFSVELHTNDNVNVGLAMCQYIQEKANMSQEDSSIKYRDIRYKTNRSKSPLSVIGSICNLNDNGTVPSEKEQSDIEQDTTGKNILAVKKPSDTGASPGQDTMDSPGQDTKDSPGQDTKDSPGQDMMDSPGQDTMDSPGQDMMDSPGQDTKDSPGQDMMDSPGQDMMDSPGQDTMDSPGQDTKDSPGQDMMDSPGQDTKDSPGQDTMDSPGQDMMDSPGQDTKDSPGQDTNSVNGKDKENVPMSSERIGEDIVGIEVLNGEVKKSVEEYHDNKENHDYTENHGNNDQGDGNNTIAELIKEDSLQPIVIDSSNDIDNPVETFVNKSVGGLPNVVDNFQSVANDIQEVCSPDSQIHPSRTSSVCPMSSPSQVITQSDTNYSVSPTLSIDLDSDVHSSSDVVTDNNTNGVSVDIVTISSTAIKKPSAADSDETVIPSPSGQEDIPSPPGQTDIPSPPGQTDIPSPSGPANLKLDLTSLSVTNNKQVTEPPTIPAIPHNYTPPMHPIIFEGANLALLINSSLSQEDGSFWAELVLNNEEQQLYTKLFNDLQSYSANKGLYTPLFFGPGDYCTAIYSEDEQWYRGKIEADNSDKRHLLVRFMDFGNSELVEIHNIMTLKNDFKQLPFRAIKCSFASKVKGSFSSKECDKFAECLSNNSVSAIVVSFDDTVVYMNAKLSDSGEDLLDKISKPKSRCYSFDMPPFEETKVSTWADRMENDVFTDTEVTRQRQSRKKSELNIKESLSGNEMSIDKRDRITPRRMTNQPKPVSVRKNSSTSKPLSRSSSSSSPVNNTRLSVDKTEVTKFLNISPVKCNDHNDTGTGDLCSSVSVNERGSKNITESGSEFIIERGSVSGFSDFSQPSKGKNGKRNKSKRKDPVKKWDSDKDTPSKGFGGQSGESSHRSYDGQSNESSHFGTFKSKWILPDHMTTMKVHGLDNVLYSEVRSMFDQYGNVTCVRSSKNHPPIYYVDIDKNGAVQAKEKLHGKRPNKKCLKNLSIFFVD